MNAKFSGLVTTSNQYSIRGYWGKEGDEKEDDWVAVKEGGTIVGEEENWITMRAGDQKRA